MILLNPTRPCASPLFPKHQSLTTAQLHLSQLLVPETHTLFALVGSKVWTRIWRWWTLPGVDFHGLLGEPAGGRKNSTNVTQSQGASAREKQFLNTEQIFVTKFVNFSERTAEAKQKKGKPWFLNQMTIRSEQLSQTKDSGHLEASEPCPPWHLWQTVVALAGLQWLSTPGASSAASAYSPGDTGRKNLKGLQVVKKKKELMESRVRQCSFVAVFIISFLDWFILDQLWTTRTSNSISQIPLSSLPSVSFSMLLLKTSSTLSWTNAIASYLFWLPPASPISNPLNTPSPDYVPH